jgi:hypothetical protein
LQVFFNLLSSFGPAGLAAAAIVYLSNKNEKREQMQAASYAASFAALAAELRESRLADAEARREQSTLERERIALMTHLVERVGALDGNHSSPKLKVQ